MTLDQIMAEWASDCKIDGDRLTTESLERPELHHKYWKIFLIWKSRYHKTCAERKTLRQYKYDYFSGDLNTKEDCDEFGHEPFLKKVLKPDLRDAVDNDQDVIDVNLKIAGIEDVCRYLESILVQIDKRGWDIKSAIDWNKFQGGVI
tara:strand:- start:14751 stop:15191 length:441 start_codon:yes stop_codon:yes gene_type:complete